jgi:hypothetical protein
MFICSFVVNIVQMNILARVMKQNHDYVCSKDAEGFSEKMKKKIGEDLKENL